MELQEMVNKAGMRPGSRTAADILVERLLAWGVDCIFGLVGDGVNPIYEALRQRRDKIRLITVRHEESAAFMASGYAKLTGRLGVCIGTSGPGAVHLVNGLFDAAMEGAPVLAITGYPNHDLAGTATTQEVNTLMLMHDLALFNHMISGPRHALTVVDLACRAALSGPGVAHLTIAKDTQMQKLSDDKSSEESAKLLGSAAPARRADVPAQEDVLRLAGLLNGAKRPALLVGRGALGAEQEVEQLCRVLNAPAAKSLLGKMVLPDDSPYTTGGIGHLGTEPSRQLLQNCDVLLILGCNMPHLDFYPGPGKATVIQVDRDPLRIGLRTSVDMGICAGVKSCVQALLPHLQPKMPAFLNSVLDDMEHWHQKLADIECAESTPLKPQYVVAEVSRVLSGTAVIAIDTGAHTVFTARHLQAKAGQKLVACGNLASMGPALPYAIAAQIAYPDRQCVAFVGDGGLTMLMGEIATAVLYSLPVRIIVFKNNALAMDRFEQEDAGAKPYGIAFQPIDFAGIAQSCGAKGYSCSDAATFRCALRDAFAEPGPCLISVDVDPDEAPLSPDQL